MKYHLIDLQEDLWQDVTEKSSSATFYHTPVWTKIITQVYPQWENATFMMEFEDGNLAIFPLLRRCLFNDDNIPWYESMVPGAYGGPIFKSEPGMDQLLDVENELKRFKNLRVVGNPFFSWALHRNISKHETFTHIIELDLDFSKVRKNFSKSRRDAIRFSKRNGVTVTEVNFSEYYQKYYEIYEDQTLRWGRQAGGCDPIALFEKLANCAIENPNIKLWLAWHGGKIVSGVIVFYHNKHVVLWHNATLTASLKLRPVDLLYSTIIEVACLDGYKYFDFGKSGGYNGVIEYKDHFGARRTPIIEYKRTNIAGTIYRGVRLVEYYFRSMRAK